MKKILSFSLVLVLVLSLLAGCGSSGDDTSKDSASNALGAISTADVKFLDGAGESVYTIVRPEDDEAMITPSQELFKAMKTALGVNVRMMFDDEDGVDKYEILLGNVNRPEIEDAKAYLESKTGGKYDDYVICTVGKKIVIYAYTNESLELAIDYFISNFLKAEGVAGGIAYTYTKPGDFETITVGGTNIGKFTFIKPHYNSSYLTQLEIEELIDTIYKKTGYMLESKHDTYTTAGNYEIIIGDASRDGVEKITDKDKYKITVKGTKVYINGGSAHATAMGVSEFAKLLSGNVTDSISTEGSYNTSIASYDKATNLYMTWSEEFDGNALDTDAWYLGHPGSPNWKGNGVGGKPWIRSHDPNDVYVKDGTFTMTARVDDQYYYGGLIQSKGTFKYGLLEMSAIIPNGIGFWSALYCQAYYQEDPSVLWPELKTQSDPEFDVMECFGDSTNFAANMHSWPRNGAEETHGWKHTSLDGQKYGNDKKYRIPDEGAILGGGFHTYSMLWSDKMVTFACDGEAYFSYDTTTTERDVETFNHNVWIRVALSVGNAENPLGSTLTENPDDWQNTNKFIVEYLNLYQYNDGKCANNMK